MRLMMLMAMLASLIAGPSMNVSHEATPSISVPREQAILVPIPTVRLSIHGGTAQWAFQFVCVDARCRFRHTHVQHRLRQAQHVNLAVRFSGFRDHQGDAAVWLRRVSATKESAEGN